MVWQSVAACILAGCVPCALHEPSLRSILTMSPGDESVCACFQPAAAGLDPYLESMSSAPPKVVQDLIQASLNHDWKAVHAQVSSSSSSAWQANSGCDTSVPLSKGLFHQQLMYMCLLASIRHRCTSRSGDLRC